MQITKNLKEDTLEIILEGRLDTATSPELEDALEGALDGIKELIFDFANLEYVSSAGLRILLSTQKLMNKQGKMIVKNVCETIMEVFEITGFSDILCIE